MKLPYSEELEIKYLSRLFDNTSECYKFFWFQALITKVLEGKEIISYEELIDEMIVEAWYMVTEYHLNLGPKDTLEVLVNYLQNLTQIKPSENKENILRYLKECTDKEVIKKKQTLIKNVPYRIQSPFIDNVKGKEWNVSERVLIEKINEERQLMYYFGIFNGMKTTINIQPQWLLYIHKNQDIIKGWLQYNMIIYLQKRNPSVPGIADKLYPPQERKLDRVKKYWKLLLDIHPVQEIYNNQLLTEKDMSIDHFVPWSYVAHDELWNLHPTTKSINSSKSNCLPDWKAYFLQFAQIEYLSYEMIWKYDVVHDEYIKCAKEHLNNEEIKKKIYKKGLTFEMFSNELSDIVQPVYQSAKDCGFKNWIYGS